MKKGTMHYWEGLKLEQDMLNNWTTNPRFIFFRVANGKQFTYKKKSELQE